MREEVCVSFDFAAFVEKSRWRFAHTMPTTPHWYVLKKDSDPEEFWQAVVHIREHGERGWYASPGGRRRSNIYLVAGEWKFWTMSFSPTATILINRARVDDGQQPELQEPEKEATESTR
jgi:hypothetical protein